MAKISPNLKKDLPRHLAIIPGGSVEWAKKQRLAPSQGYKHANKAIKDNAIAALGLGVPIVSAYMFGFEEWGGEQDIIHERLQDIILFCQSYESEFKDKNIRVLWLGSKEFLPPAVHRALDGLVAATVSCNNGTFIMGVNYSGQQEVIESVRKLLRARFDPVKLSAKDISRGLYHPNLPAPDLLLQTGGQYVVSDFLQWRAAGAKIMVADTLWPEFTVRDLGIVLRQFVGD